MTDLIRGSKGGSSSSQTPTESPDSLHSTALANIVDLLCEGEIRGFHHGLTGCLQDIYLNQTPVANSDGSLNFQNVQIDSRAGTQDQGYMPGFPDVESETAISLELRSTAAWSQTLSNIAISSVRITLSVPQLEQTNATTGDITGYNISYKIDLATDGGSFVNVVNSAFNGKTTTKYERSHLISLPVATTGWVVRVTRLTANANLATISDTTTIESYTEIVDALLRYPNSAYVGSIFDAAQFDAIPSRAFDMYGRIIQIPSNYDPIARTYTGVWDGTFQSAWTDNPAWIFYDLATNTRFGLGQRVSPDLMNKWSLYTISQYCDGMVSDGMGGTEPRFRCSLYLQSQADATQVLADLSSVFRGMAYWAGGAIQTNCDSPLDPDYVYTNANVINGKFTYIGSSRKTRYTEALVTWNNPANFGQQEVLYVPDREGIARYGVQTAQITAVGCTSRGQAQRFGLWTLLTSRLETETVTFAVGLEGTIVAPGSIIQIADAPRAGKRQGGRVRSATATAITVDQIPDLAAPGDTLTCMLPSGASEMQTILSIAGNVINVTGAGFSVAPAAQAVWGVSTASLNMSRYRVLSVAAPDSDDSTLAYTITAVLNNASKYAAIDSGAPIVVPPIIAITSNAMTPPTLVTLSSYETAGTILTSTVLDIQWTPVDGAVGYNVQYQANNQAWIDLGVVRTTEVTVPSIMPGVYVAQVRSVNGSNVRSAPAVSAPLLVVDQTTLPTSVIAAGTTASNATPAFIINPNFALPAPGTLANWVSNTAQEGWYVETDGLFSPNPQIPSYAVHAGSTEPENPLHFNNSALRNLGSAPATPGEPFAVSAQIHCQASPNGYACARISWRDIHQNEIGVVEGNHITSVDGTSTVLAVAPEGAVYAHAEAVCFGHNNGYYTFTGFVGSFQSVTLSIIEPTTVRTSTAPDNNQIIECTNVAGCTITIDPVSVHGFPSGATLYALQAAAGQVKFVAASGVTFLPSDSTATRAQGSMIGMEMISDGTSVDTWQAVGDLAYTAPSTSVVGNSTGSTAQPTNIVVAVDGQLIIRRAGALVSDNIHPTDIIGGFAVAAGVADVITASFSPAPTLTDGYELRVRALLANATTTPTFNPNAIGALTITKLGGKPLAAGDIAGVGHELILRYRASPTRFELINPASAAVTGFDIATSWAVQ